MRTNLRRTVTPIAATLLVLAVPGVSHVAVAQPQAQTCFWIYSSGAQMGVVTSIARQGDPRVNASSLVQHLFDAGDFMERAYLTSSVANPAWSSYYAVQGEMNGLCENLVQCVEGRSERDCLPRRAAEIATYAANARDDWAQGLLERPPPGQDPRPESCETDLFRLGHALGDAQHTFGVAAALPAGDPRRTPLVNAARERVANALYLINQMMWFQPLGALSWCPEVWDPELDLRAVLEPITGALVLERPLEPAQLFDLTWIARARIAALLGDPSLAPFLLPGLPPGTAPIPGVRTSLPAGITPVNAQAALRQPGVIAACPITWPVGPLDRLGLRYVREDGNRLIDWQRRLATPPPPPPQPPPPPTPPQPPPRDSVRPPPTGPCPPITGTWKRTGGGIWTISQSGATVTWVGKSADEPFPDGKYFFYQEFTGTMLDACHFHGTWVDVAEKSIMKNRGTIVMKIISGKVIRAVSEYRGLRTEPGGLLELTR